MNSHTCDSLPLGFRGVRRFGLGEGDVAGKREGDEDGKAGGGGK
jgi:hypothetical protein